MNYTKYLIGALTRRNAILLANLVGCPEVELADTRTAYFPLSPPLLKLE